MYSMGSIKYNQKNIHYMCTRLTVKTIHKPYICKSIIHVYMNVPGVLTTCNAHDINMYLC